MKAHRTAAMFAAWMSAIILLDLRFAADADAVYGVRRRTARRTAIVVGSTASANNARAEQDAANAEQRAAAAEQDAANAEQRAAAAEQDAAAARAEADAANRRAQAATSGAQPVGRVATSLPSGCKPVTVDGVEYQQCGPDYYRVAFQGSQLVYVTAQP